MNTDTASDNVIGIIGDTHGHYGDTKKALEKILAFDPTITTLYQLGDFNYGFDHADIPIRDTCMYTRRVSNWCELNNVMLHFISGNHENHERLHRITGYDRHAGIGGMYRVDTAVKWVAPGTWVRDLNMLCLGGAFSIDVESRTKGVDWWEEEELSEAEIELAMCSAPKIVLTHDIPTWSKHSFTRHATFSYGEELQRRAIDHSKQIDRVLNVVKPRLTIHGHLHVSYMQDTPKGLLVGVAATHQRHSAVVLNTSTLQIEFLA